jgi:hypothetical protein
LAIPKIGVDGGLLGMIRGSGLSKIIKIIISFK